MNGKELSIALREMARVQKKPLCDEWYSEWKDDTDIDSLLDKYIRGLDFAQENDYPPIEFIRSNFKTEDLLRHNIYVDHTGRLDDVRSGIYVFLGNCTSEVYISGLVAVTMIVRHSCDIKVYADGGAKVFVRVYEGADAVCRSDGWSVVKKYNRKNK